MHDFIMDEYMQGYMDASDPDCPEPSGNRDPRYIHSFRVKRAEMAGKPIPAAISRQRATSIEAGLRLAGVSV